jgi:DNA-binding GntR family transcriptional regulator
MLSAQYRWFGTGHAMLQKTNLADQIVAVLQERIIVGEIAGDAPLRQDTLAAELGVSKIPLREAFAKLEQAGLIVSEANRGYFVRPLTAAEAYDVFDLRLKIEPDAAARGSVDVSPSAVELARRALADLDEATLARSPRVGACNRAFHLALIRPASTPVTLMMVERLHMISERYVARHLAPQGRPSRAMAEHKAIFGAWAEGQGEEVRQLTASHVASTLSDLRAEFEAG